MFRAKSAKQFTFSRIHLKLSDGPAVVKRALKTHPKEGTEGSNLYFGLFIVILLLLLPGL